MRIAVVAAAISLCVIGISAASDTEAAIRKPVNIPAQGLGAALQALAKDRGFQVVYLTDAVDPLRTQGAVGEFTPEEALKTLLHGTGLAYRYLDERTVTIFPASVPSSQDERGGGASTPAPATATKEQAAAANPEEGKDRGRLWERFRVAQVDQGASAGSATVAKKGEPASERQPLLLEEVIVTAQKREERLQDVPISIAVISTQDIERRGLIGMEDYLRSIPGVNQIDQGPVSSAIVIRGITTSPTSENTYSGTTVSSYFDETPITGAAGQAGGAIDLRPVDLDRIEVLRGPQGTTFGDASLGGTLRVIPAKPQLSGFSGNLAADYSNTSGFGGDNSMIQGILNIPIVTDVFALRAVGYRYDESGFYRNLGGSDTPLLTTYQNFGLANLVRGYAQDHVGGVVTTGGRLSALWKPTDRLSVSANYLTQTIEQDGAPEAQVGTFEQARAPIAPQARIRGEAGEIADSKIHLSNLAVNYDLGWSTLTSIVSYIDSGAVATRDYSWIFPFPASSVGPSDYRSFTGEARLASHLDGRVQFLVGGFYEKAHDEYVDTLDWPGPPATSPFGNPLAVIDITRKLEQRAVFGEASYELTNQIKATVGGRYFKYQKNEGDFEEGALVGIPIGAGTETDLQSSEGHSTYKADLSYRPTKDALLYALWSEGFRLGRPQSTALVSAACDSNHDGLIDGTNISIDALGNVKSDLLNNYELGGKFTLADHRMVVDAAIYHINWTGLPISTVASNCPIGFTANVGAATSDGAEFQASLFVVEGLKLDFGGGYTNARLSKPGLGAPEGARLPGSPRASANLGAQYEFNIASHKAFVRAESFYAGKFYGDLLETAGTAAGDYVKVDARAGVAIKGLSVEVFGRNLTNSDAFTWRNTSVVSPLFGYRLQPRTLGIQLGYSFR